MSKEAYGRTGIGLYPDAMVEHDDQVGELLAKLDELGIADNTIVIFSTDNGAEKFSWPDGGTSPFYGEKGTTNEGGFRVPQLVRWPGVIKPGTKINAIMSHEDWMPTLLAAVGEPDLVEKMKQRYRANGKDFRVHLDGYNFLPFFKGETDKGPRETIFYFTANGELNAVRWGDFKGTFATMTGGIMVTQRETPNWPIITNLRADPFETAHVEALGYMPWHADNMWLFVPLQQKINDFLASLEGYPMQEGSYLSASEISGKNLQLQQRLKALESK